MPPPSTASVLDLEKKWYLVHLPSRQCSLKDIATSSITTEEMDAYYQEAQSVLDAETSQSEMDRGRWYNAQFLQRGTTADKIAAAAVKLADTDFMFFLDGFNLLFDAARTDTHHYEAALKALTAVWPKLLPPRPLKRFVSQYFATLPTDEQERKKTLVYWYLEDYLKRTYAQFLSLSEAMLKDRLVQRREAWLEVVGKLLTSVAEGRSVAMAMMIDKLGDPNTTIGHKAYHYLIGLLAESSIHQGALFVELEKIIFTKNCPLRTMRYAVNLMNQLVFSKDERKLALKSVQTYLSLFRQLVTTGNADSSVTTAIIVGLRRAFPYSGTDIGPIEDHLNALFVMANTGNFQQRVATLSLLQLIAMAKGTPASFQIRWYRALYQLLLVSPKQIPQSTQLTNFFSTLHKAMRADKNAERVAAFVHRLLQRAVFFNDAMVCAVLLLVGEMAQTHTAVRALIRGPQKVLTEKAHAAAKADTRGKNTDDEYAHYDPKARDPQFAHASTECLWILNMFAHHSHPSVVKLAVLLLFGEEIVFDVHPLDDMTTLNFLGMFVDAKVKPKDEEKTVTGMSVFRRASHTAAQPSASDPYFIHAKAEDVDVSALFLHRYAVQRQRFLDALSQVRSTWGDTSGEADVAVRVGDIDSALFGPSGVLGDGVDATLNEEAQDDEATTGKSGKKAKGKKARAAAAVAVDEADRDEDVPSAEDDDSEESDKEDGTSAFFDQPGSESDLEWGSDDEAAYDGALEGEDGFSGEDEVENEDALGGARHRDEADDGDDFAEIMETHKQEMSKKRKREEAWLDQRSAPARPRFEGAPRGRGAGRGFGRGGGMSGGRGFAGRGGSGPSRGRGGARGGGRGFGNRY